MLRSALVGVLLLALGMLGGVLLERRTTLALLAERSAAGSAISWTTLSSDDRRVAAIFGIAQIAGVRDGVTLGADPRGHARQRVQAVDGGAHAGDLRDPEDGRDPAIVG